MNHKPLFVAISDVHFTLNTLPLAEEAYRAAINKAHFLGVPLIDCGDLTNDKAILRAEIVNKLIELFTYANTLGVKTYCLVGNHSLLNEKNSETHALNFLRPYTTIIDNPQNIEIGNKPFTFIPYYSSTELFKSIVDKAPPGNFIIMHQGVNGAFMGDYIQDKSSVDSSIFVDRHVFSGHYHRHQQLGNVTYIGNPYTISFGEANDSEKGFLVVNDDGSFINIPTNLRKHIVKDITLDYIEDDIILNINNTNDLIWLKINAPRSVLAKIDKKQLGKKIGHQNFKLDKIPTDVVNSKKIDNKMTDNQVLDQLIDNTSESLEKKKDLKQLWRKLLA